MADKKKKSPSIDKQLAKLVGGLKPHLTFLVVCLAIVVVGLWAYHSTQMIYVSRDETAYKNNLSETIPPVFDQMIIDKIRAMHSSGVKNPGTNYQQDRTNPFAE